MWSTNGKPVADKSQDWTSSFEVADPVVFTVTRDISTADSDFDFTFPYDEDIKVSFSHSFDSKASTYKTLSDQG